MNIVGPMEIQSDPLALSLVIIGALIFFPIWNAEIKDVVWF
jgi:hypothetical protein